MISGIFEMLFAISVASVFLQRFFMISGGARYRSKTKSRKQNGFRSVLPRPVLPYICQSLNHLYAQRVLIVVWFGNLFSIRPLDLEGKTEA